MEQIVLVGFYVNCFSPSSGDLTVEKNLNLKTTKKNIISFLHEYFNSFNVLFNLESSYRVLTI